MATNEKLGDAILGKLGGILIGGFGEKAAIGFLIGLLDNTTPDDCYDFLASDSDLFPDVTDEEWEKYAKFVARANVSKIDNERILHEFQKRRPDLLGVVINYPGGLKWFDQQFGKIRHKLNLLQFNPVL